MHGINKINGKPLTGIAHLKQSIKDILTTPIGSRIMRRDYGSRLFELVDRPMDGAKEIRKEIRDTQKTLPYFEFNFLPKPSQMVKARCLLGAKYLYFVAHVLFLKEDSKAASYRGAP